MKNIGAIDRSLRIAGGLVLVLLAIVPSGFQSAWGWLGLVPLATALLGWCPAYTLLGIRTCRVRGPEGEAPGGA